MGTRDMSKQQFETALHRRGFKKSFLGYWQLPNSNVYVAAINGGPTRREQLAFLISEERKRNRMNGGNSETRRL